MTSKGHSNKRRDLLFTFEDRIRDEETEKLREEGAAFFGQPILFGGPQGLARMNCRVSRVTAKKPLEEIVKKLAISTARARQKYMIDYSFFAVSLDLSVSMENPVSTHLDYARFNFKLLCDGSEILSLVPDTKGKSVPITKTEERRVTISPAFKDLSGIEFESKTGYSYKIPAIITEVKGVVLEPTQAQLDIYGDRMAPALGPLGATSVVKAFLTIKLPRNMECNIEVNVEGRVVSLLAGIFKLHGPVKMIGPRVRPIFKKDKRSEKNPSLVPS